MIDDLFELVLGPAFPCDSNPSPGPNGFELLYSHPLGVNKRRTIDEGIYPVPELAQPRRKIVKPKFISVKRQQEQNHQHRFRDVSPAVSATEESSKKAVKNLLSNSPYSSVQTISNYG
jgi:hypothetical protein